jgi:hypothetical protein
VAGIRVNPNGSGAIVSSQARLLETINGLARAGPPCGILM